MLTTKHLFKSFQCPPMHRFRLFIFPLLVKHTAKVVDTAERMRMLASKHLLSCLQRPSMHRFCLIIFPLPGERCIDGRYKDMKMCLDTSI
jgi:hypothetical protein